jgi:hypothetical protein
MCTHCGFFIFFFFSMISCCGTFSSCGTVICKLFSSDSNSAPRNAKPWMSGSKLNCRGSNSPAPMEAIFFGPQVGGSAVKCAGGMAGRLLHARNAYHEICSLLLGAMDALKRTLSEFSTVLPHQWASLLNATPNSKLDIEQRLKKLAESAKVSDEGIFTRIFQ